MQNSNRLIINGNAPENKLRGYVFTALFAGTAAAVGYLLIFVPNIEAITAILFCAGYALGVKRGILASVIAALLYFGLNPQGFFLPLLIAQVIGISSAPIAGVLYRSFAPNNINGRIYLVFSALIVTLWYDLLSNLAYPLVAGFGIKGIVAMFIGGAVPSLIHITGNIFIFNLIIPPVLSLINQRFPVF
ncbi:hypothetical protein K9N50_10250 [bacterium]|nr:hypothetical protein [bacterium]